jgi:hypothetical protein
MESASAAGAPLRFSAVIWVYPGKGGWRFVTLPRPIIEALRFAAPPQGRGWRSLPVVATIGATTWSTSAFPDGHGSWSLPIKAETRRREGLVDGQEVEIALTLAGAPESPARLRPTRSRSSRTGG